MRVSRSIIRRLNWIRAQGPIGKEEFTLQWPSAPLPPHRRPYHGEVSHLGETEVVLTCVPCGEEVTEGPRERLQSQAMGTVICLFSEGSDTKGQKHCSRAHHTTPAWMLPVTESSRLYLQVLLVR